MSHGLEEGSSSPVGATPSPSGVNAEPERQRVALNQLIREADITWHGVRLHEPDWRHSSHSVALTAKFTTHRVFVHVILNAYWEPLEFELPSAPTALEIHGADGSTPSSIPHRISSTGSERPRFPAIATGRSHAPWWCCSPASSRSANRRAAVELCMRRDQGIARRAMNLVWAGVRETRGKALEEM